MRYMYILLQNIFIVCIEIVLSKLVSGALLRWEFIKEKKESKIERKHAIDQESDQEKKKNDNGQEKKKKTRSRPRKKKENKNLTKKKKAT